MSSSDTGCGDGEELGLEAAAEAGGLTNFSKGGERRKEQRKHTSESGHTGLLSGELGKSQASTQFRNTESR